MGLRINQNIAAQNAYRNLSVTDSQMSKSLEKLSSGFRINRAADDAAGLSISEGLRAQIGGLKVAVRNAQEGVSVVQTAEGALTEVHSILQRMRDLAVQSTSDGSQNADARGAAQTELTQLNAELDRIGTTTSFGKTKLLDGSYGLQAAKVTGTTQVDLATVTAAMTTTVNLFESDGAATPAIQIAAAGSVTVGAATGTAAGDITNDAAGAAKLQKQLQDAIDLDVDMKGKARASVTFDTVTNLASVSFVRTGATTKFDSIGSTVQAGLGLAASETAALNVGTAVGVTQVSGTGATFQVGANNTTADKIMISVAKIDSNSLGTASIDLINSAAAATDILDAAIGSVSETRGNLGAFQNRFEHAINNLNVTVENLSASESRIRDTDMAQEMVSFTRAQILTQAGTAMLSQANQAPQSVLSLLR
jgi:flagellin